MPQPNIIYVFADQMRSTALGCAGVERVHTPNLDAFAAQGTRFTNAVSNTPVCSPSRATLLTGLHALTHRLVFNDIMLRTDVRCLADVLNEAGYRCGYVGKWHIDVQDRGAFTPPGPRRRGFDDFWASYNCHHSYLNGYYYTGDSPDPVWVDGYMPDAETDLAIGYLQQKAVQRDPFCLMLSWGPPHCPYRQVPQRFLDMYPPESIELMPSARQGRVHGGSGPGPTAEEDRAKREQIAGYYAHVSALDDCFGRLMAAIEAAGIADNTIVVFSSDHGDMLFNHNRGWKCKPYRESVGVPLLVRWDGQVPAGRVAPAPVGIVDHMPTLLHLAGLAAPEGVQGQDLWAYFLGDDSAAPHSQLISFPVMPENYSYGVWRGVVTSRHTYATLRDRPWVLFDDQADPMQMTNLVGSPAHAAMQADLDAQTRAWLGRTNDPFESSREVADKHYAGHVNCVMPYFENETIRQGYATHKRSG
ncbi:MAG: sulfatase [Planctomycetaceae bacterium]|nr:sulfatase [Planctomycetaceae bacterium]